MEKNDRNQQIGIVYSHLEGVNKPTQKVLTEVSNLKKIDPVIEPGEYSDYRVQVVTDAVIEKLVPDIMQVLTKLQYVPMYMVEAEKQKRHETNKGLQEEIAKLMEKHAIHYIVLDNVLNVVGGTVAAIVKESVQIMNNKTGDVLMDLGKKHFEADMLTMGHIATYTKGVYDAAAAKKEEEGEKGGLESEPKPEEEKPKEDA